MPREPGSPVVLRPGNGVRTPLVLAVLLLAGLSVYLAIAGVPDWRFWGALVLLLLAAAWLGADLVSRRARSLTLAPKGFTERGTRGETPVAWSRVESFEVYHILRIPLVGYRLKARPHRADGPGGYSPPPAVLRHSPMPDGWLRGCYGMRARELARLMNEWLERHGS